MVIHDWKIPGGMMLNVREAQVNLSNASRDYAFRGMPVWRG
jgi:hypothetical protein